MKTITFLDLGDEELKFEIDSKDQDEPNENALISVFNKKGKFIGTTCISELENTLSILKANASIITDLMENGNEPLSTLS